MSRLPVRLITSGMLAASLAACSGASGVVPPAHRGTSGKLTAATFTIKWTNPTATAAMRRKDTISPSAASILVAINGKTTTIANRNGQPTQTVALDAPVGSDVFAFTVYDMANAEGHVLGTASVTQEIVDGAANTVSAAIQASCVLTNVSYTNNAHLAYYTLASTSGINAPSLSLLVIEGKEAPVISVQPQDVDGNVIITAPTGGQVPYSLNTGYISVTQIDSGHLRLSNLSATRVTTPYTLTVAAPGCPTTTVGLESSPVIYAENTSFDTYMYDWYGHELGGTVLPGGTAVIGYDTASGNEMTYNSTSGQVLAWTTDLRSATPLYTVHTGAVTAWSNYLHGIFGSYRSGSNNQIFSYSNGQPTYFALQAGAATTAVAAGLSSYDSSAFTSNGTSIFSFSLSSSAFLGSVSSPSYTVSLSTASYNSELLAFNSSSPYLSQYSESLGTPNSVPFVFGDTPVVGALDSDQDDIYMFLASTAFEAETGSGTSIPAVNIGLGNGLAVSVTSANE